MASANMSARIVSQFSLLHRDHELGRISSKGNRFLGSSAEFLPKGIPSLRAKFNSFNKGARAVSEKDKLAQEFSRVALGTAKSLKRVASEAGKVVESFRIEEVKSKTELAAVQLLQQAEVVSAVLKEQADRATGQIQKALEDANTGGALAEITEDAPEPIKEIAETAISAHSAEAAKKGAVIHDFCLGIVYGGFLVASGVVSFIISGSLEAVRFGILLGGILLASSVGSLNVWKKGKSSSPYIFAQIVCALGIFVREAAIFTQFKQIPSGIAATLSIGMVLFYLYVLLAGGNPPKKVATA